MLLLVMPLLPGMGSLMVQPALTGHIMDIHSTGMAREGVLAVPVQACNMGCLGHGRG